ncbi:outer membrane protein [Palleronia aestuarii]|uniref:Outer membrane protein n=1 Tax=Palleronia aestuarii TaxID=568105 RepID=A0A2W7Q2L0_9RHOB|nr:TolC family outer membrane protein [Palleronia aestuarii]PZX15989.1 outer membrane protein [Palleronia aestuarii]
MTILRRFGALALTGLLCLPALPSRAETLTDALILAYRHSGLLEKNRAVLRAADEDVAQAIATLRPIISYTASAARQYQFPNDGTSESISPLIPGQRNSDDSFNSASFSISADLLLWDGRQTALAVDAARELVLVTREALTAVEQQILWDAAQAYLGVLDAQAFVELRQSNLQLLSRELQAARDRFEVGEVTRTDVAVAEAALASARSLLATSQGDLDLARAQYVEAVGQPPGNLAPTSALPQTAATLEAAQAIARQTHPTIRRDMRSITVAELNVERAERAVKPTIRARSSFTIGQDFEETGSIGLEMSGPIYRGGEITSIYRQAIANRDETRADLHITVDDVLLQVAQAWAQLAVSRARIDASQLEVRAAQVAFRGLQEEATLGARTTLDVLDAEQNLSDARANLISAQTSEVLASFQLLVAMGLMTVEHLNLGIVTYDPSVYYNAVRNAPSRKVSPRGEKMDSLLRALGKN